APAEHRVLVVSDFPHGYQPIDAQRLHTLTACGDLIGLSIIVVGTDEIPMPDEAVAALSQHARHLPTVAETPMFDPWTGSASALGDRPAGTPVRTGAGRGRSDCGNQGSSGSGARLRMPPAGSSCQPRRTGSCSGRQIWRTINGHKPITASSRTITVRVNHC